MVDTLAQERHLEIKEDIKSLHESMEKLTETVQKHIVEDSKEHQIIKQNTNQISLLNEKVIEGNGQPSISEKLTTLIESHRSFQKSIKLERKFLYAVLTGLTIVVFALVVA